MDSLPTWLITSSETPTKILENFQVKVQALFNNPNGKAINLQIDELIKIGGILNQPCLAILLPKPLRIVYQNSLKTKDQRFQQITKNCLSDLKIEGREPRFDQIKDLYNSTSIYSINYFHNVIQEVALYLLSQPMPLQSTKFLGYYEIILFRKAIDARHEKLMKTITFIFEMTQTKEALEEMVNSMLKIKCEAIETKESEYLIQVTSDKQAFREFLNLEQEHLLFKYAALIGQSCKVSWVYFFYCWANQSSYGKPFVELIDKHFCLDKFLVQEKKNLIEKKIKRPLSNISSRSYLIQQTTQIFFKMKTSIIPSGKWEIDLQKQFTLSEDIRQDTMYYIDYLDNLCRKSSERFSTKIEPNSRGF
ncbi:MAG: hypothetical protein H0T62_07750 [Parachlamydiaceae bacterium]|nr:hypothetical protein [Parachlamydiaceae bacterium]